MKDRNQVSTANLLSLLHRVSPLRTPEHAEFGVTGRNAHYVSAPSTLSDSAMWGTIGTANHTSTNLLDRR